MNCRNGGNHQLVEVSAKIIEEKVVDKITVTTTRVVKCSTCDKVVEL